MGAVLDCPAGKGVRLGGGVARRKVGGGFGVSVICYVFSSYRTIFYSGQSPVFYKNIWERSAGRSSTRKPPYSTRMDPCAAKVVKASFTRWRDKPTR